MLKILAKQKKTYVAPTMAGCESEKHEAGHATPVVARFRASRPVWVLMGKLDSC